MLKAAKQWGASSSFLDIVAYDDIDFLYYVLFLKIPRRNLLAP
jgi:hypothetical protein